GQDLDGDEAVERFLTGLVDGAHAALAQQFEEFKLRKVGVELLRCRRHESAVLRGRRCARLNRGMRLAFQPDLEQAVRAQPLGRPRRHLGPPQRATICFPDDNDYRMRRGRLQECRLAVSGGPLTRRAKRKRSRVYPSKLRNKERISSSTSLSSATVCARYCA